MWWGKRHLRLAMEAAGIALWSWNVQTDKLKMDRRGFLLWGLDRRREVCFADLSAQIHPSDRDRVRAGFAATRAIDGAFEIDFRIMVNDEVRWVSARGQGSDRDIRRHCMYGVFLDVTGRKQAEEGNELLAGEMSHRVKNLLSIASGLTAITSKSSTTAKQMARQLTERLGALGRAHDLVQTTRASSDGALLGDMLTILLAPYDDMGAFQPRVRVSVPRLAVGQTSATSVAMVIHELATNSLKHGALSVDHGTLDIACDEPGDDLKIIWTESGGPEVIAPKDAEGFGNTLIMNSMTRQLGGSITYDWDPAGLIVVLTMRRDRLAQ